MKIVNENFVQYWRTLFTNVTLPYMSHSKLFIVNKAHGKTDCHSWFKDGLSLVRHRWPKRNMRVCMGKIEFET